jgi:hypothetical protein
MMVGMNFQVEKMGALMDVFHKSLYKMDITDLRPIEKNWEAVAE